MADKPDLNKLKSKLDINGIIDSVKSIINPASGTPDVDPDDDLGVKIAQASTMIKEMAAAQAEHVKQLGKLNEMLNMAFQDIETLRKEVQVERAKKPVEKPVTVKAEALEPAEVESESSEPPSESAVSDEEKKS